MNKKIKIYLKLKFPSILNYYYKIRFYIRAIYIKEARAHLMWILRKGDKKFHKNFGLNSDAVFFDVGGFEGEFTDKILAEYKCKSFIFEPHPVFYQKLKSKYKSNNNVQVYNYGLGGKTEYLHLIDQSASSKLTKAKTDIKIKVMDISEVINELGIQKIDLIKLNIEGSEYDLLEKLLDSNLIERIDKLQIQFHDNISEAEIRRKKIINELKKSHKLVWSYYFVWERWDKIAK